MQKLISTLHYKVTKVEREMIHTGSMRLLDFIPIYKCEIEYYHRTKTKIVRFKMNGIIKDEKNIKGYFNLYDTLKQNKAKNYIIREVIKENKKNQLKLAI